MQNTNIHILAIESSCDDTSCAVLRNNKVLSNIVSSQTVHISYGGIVPELASRDHQKQIVPVLEEAIRKSGVPLQEMNAIAVTLGPGLTGSLLVGLNFAKSLSLALNIPLLTVNHMQAHVLAHFIEEEGSSMPEFPFLCLTVSGGHTQLVKVDDYLEHTIIGNTKDDAVGEAFDKAAKIIGLPYPGGPLINKLADNGNAGKFTFPDAKIEGFDFSFSGIKTAFLYFIQKETQRNAQFVSENLADICASYQNHLIKQLLTKTKEALIKTGMKHLALAGGVSANTQLRKQVQELGIELGLKTYIPKFEYCTDNAAMIGIAGYYLFLKKEFSGLEAVPFPNS